MTHDQARDLLHELIAIEVNATKKQKISKADARREHKLLSEIFAALTGGDKLSDAEIDDIIG